MLMFCTVVAITLLDYLLFGKRIVMFQFRYVRLFQDDVPYSDITTLFANGSYRLLQYIRNIVRWNMNLLSPFRNLIEFGKKAVFIFGGGRKVGFSCIQ